MSRDALDGAAVGKLRDVSSRRRQHQQPFNGIAAVAIFRFRLLHLIVLAERNDGWTEKVSVSGQSQLSSRQDVGLPASGQRGLSAVDTLIKTLF